ncbi:MAG TPA: TfoX/Sxy family protein [Anaerolineaceae bacterium]|jgi:TfoX/Sxy family transcriptional regulator of competence genes
MAYNLELAERMRAVVNGMASATEKKMFGGVGFMVNGNMACGVHGDGLISRVGDAAYPKAKSQPHVRDFDMTGRPMKGWVVVDLAGCQSEIELRRWVSVGIDFAASLPPKLP